MHIATGADGLSANVSVHLITSGGRVLVADSLTYFSTGVLGNDVVVGASFAGIPTSAVPLSAGAKGLIGHDAGVGRESAGIAGLALAQELGVPAVAIAGSSAKLSDGRSLLLGTVSHANKAALELGVERHMLGEKAALLLLKARASTPQPSVISRVDQTIARIAGDSDHGIYAVWSFMLVKDKCPNDVFCVASNAARVMADYAASVAPMGVIANDAGMGMDESGIDGLPVLDERGTPAAAVSVYSARIGDPMSTYHDGVISAINRCADRKGVRLGMPARVAAEIMSR